MKLAVTLSNPQAIGAYKASHADAVIVGLEKLSMRIKQQFSLEALDEIIEACQKENLKLYVLANALLHEEDLEWAERAVEELAQKSVDGILVADLAMINFAKKANILSKLIYYPETYTTSYEDTLFFDKLGLKRMVVGREVTLKGILAMAQGPMELLLVGHGFLNMFHSRRPLVENYFKHTKDQEAHVVKDKRNLKLVEETRDEAYPIIQDEYGTHIYRAKALASFSVLKTLSQAIDTMIIDTYFLEDDAVLTILEDYHRALQGRPIVGKYDDCDDGFYFKETITVKGDA